MTIDRPPVRSYLFAPANNTRLLEKVYVAGADAVVLDLEDAVAPSEKKRARSVLATALAARVDAKSPPTWVRINGERTDLWREDLAAVVGPGLTGIRLPKAESPDAVRRVTEVLAGYEEAAGLASGSVQVMLTIESALGVLNCRDLAACESVSGFSFGNVDFLADIGARDAEDGFAALYAHSRLVLASRAAGKAPPVAPVSTRLNDLDGLRATTEHFKNLGFFGRSCIHPRQLAIVHEVFTPTQQEVEAARNIVAAYESAADAASGVEVTAGGQFVDIAVVRRAWSVLDLVASIEERETDSHQRR